MMGISLPAGNQNSKAIQAISSEIFRAQALAVLLSSESGMQALEQLDDSMRFALFAHHADHLKRIREAIDSIVEQPGVDERVAEVLWAVDSQLAEAQDVASLMTDPDAIQTLIAHAMPIKVALAAGHAGRLGNVLRIVDQLDA